MAKPLLHQPTVPILLLPLWWKDLLHCVPMPTSMAESLGNSRCVGRARPGRHLAQRGQRGSSSGVEGFARVRMGPGPPVERALCQQLAAAQGAHAAQHLAPACAARVHEKVPKDNVFKE